MRRYLFLLPLLFFPLTGQAITGPDSRFDWTLGLPSVTADPTTACNDTAQARFDWSLGQPSVVHDATANCTAAAAAATTDAQPRALFLQGTTNFNSGSTIIP